MNLAWLAEQFQKRNRALKLISHTNLKPDASKNRGSSAEGIIQYGRVPGGRPKSTGRAHVYFNPTPPWEAQMRKLAGTRTGRPVTVAFDTELMMQDGIRFFTSDEAFMSADWVGNAYIIYAFQTRKNKFLYFNRAYPELRKRYRAALTGAHAQATGREPELLQEREHSDGREGMEALAEGG